MEENVNKETPFVSQENSTPLEEPKCLHHFSVGQVQLGSAKISVIL